MKALTTATLIAAMLAMTPALALAQETASPVGLWKNIDDVTGKPKALIRISDNNGEIQGKLEKLFRPEGTDQNPKCTKCEGANKDQPILGMTFMSGLKKEGDEYTGGQILDPDNGKVYKSKLKVVEGGKKLNVRGYMGMPVFGRSQVWVREE
ncbi:DUF2147 domain-containing protein [Massilia sp. CCM 8695]|uniref:DUF2147 domain-containing protein n=1 Tax=Massilia frigida TaxID=2609281 RepID=A0ABX0NC19_9BURK|nr:MULTISPECIES: DUF2147 domain-containing protein [Massilia]MDM5176329.1 DUF2147 domain-containing protein [Massilia sp. DJPM01]NHZ82996.1 DUF2147 domain-containing protein [Massilia frigida]